MNFGRQFCLGRKYFFIWFWKSNCANAMIAKILTIFRLTKSFFCGWWFLQRFFAAPLDLMRRPFQSPCGGRGRSDCPTSRTSPPSLLSGFNHLTVEGVGQTLSWFQEEAYCCCRFQSPYGGRGRSDGRDCQARLFDEEFQSPCGGSGRSDRYERGSWERR